MRKTTTAILDLDTSWNAAARRGWIDVAHDEHLDLTLEVRAAEFRMMSSASFRDRSARSKGPIFFEMPDATLFWEQFVLSFALGMLAVVAVYPLVWAIWRWRSKEALPHSLTTLAFEQYPGEGLIADDKTVRSLAA